MGSVPKGAIPPLRIESTWQSPTTPLSMRMGSSTEDVHEEAKTKGEGGVETVRPSHESNSRRKKKKKKRKEVNAARNQAETNPEEADGEASRTGEAAHRCVNGKEGRSKEERERV